MAAIIDVIDARTGDSSALQALCQRSLADLPDHIEADVRHIVEDVRRRGDEALIDYERQFDCANFTAEHLVVSSEEIEEAYAQVSSAQLGALRRARENVYEFYLKGRPCSWLDEFDGVWLGQRVTPVDSAGIYVPARSAPLPSTVYMCAMPARVAEVPRIAICSPPRKDGSLDALTLVAAAECGVDEIYRLGGAQAIAALAFGTESVEPVSKVVGPGNPWVTMAKKYVYGIVGIDSLAGPSEVLVIADAAAEPAIIAADLLAQAEHTGDNMTVLITPSEVLVEQVTAELQQQVAGAERMAQIQDSLSEFGAIVLVRDLHHAARLASDIAPEHLQLLVEEPLALLAEIDHAGCVCIGELTPVPLGDYAAGPSHVLPTGGTARFASGLAVDDFVKRTSLISATRRGLDRLAPDVIELAKAEGLAAHANAVQRRQH